MPDPIEPYDSLFKPCRQPSKSSEDWGGDLHVRQGLRRRVQGLSGRLGLPGAEHYFLAPDALDNIDFRISTATSPQSECP